MTETLTVTVFTFDELGAEAQEKAVEDYRDANIQWLGADWDEEWRDCVKALETHFNFSIDYGRHGIWLEWSHDEDVQELSGVRAWTWLYNNGLQVTEEYYPTGYCGDHAMFAPLVEFGKRPDGRSVADVGRDCAQALFDAWEADREYSCSDEAIRERLSDTQEDRYLENGTVYPF
jgi:hypothetical protein